MIMKKTWMIIKKSSLAAERKIRGGYISIHPSIDG
jgi:hypothetical protein